VEKQNKIILTVAIITIIGMFYFYKKSHKKDVPNSDESKKNDDSIKSILFVGDSNTEAPFSYADKIKQKFPNITTKKLAVKSMKTDWMYNQLLEELSKNHYDAVSILGGSNDIWATGKNDMAKTYLDKMYDLAKSKGAKVIAITPPNKNFYTLKTPEKQAQLFDLNTWIVKNPKKDYLLDFWTITNNPKFFTKADGYLHAQSPAHEILANQFINKVNLK